jgi:hypothetical protein
MIRKIKNSLSYKYKKLALWLERSNSTELTISQKKVIDIFSKILKDPNTKLYTSPLDDKHYIKKFEDGNVTIFITINKSREGYRLVIISKNFSPDLVINGKNIHDVIIPDTVGKILVSKLYKELKRVTSKMEEEIMRENESNLSDLINHLK